MFLGAFYRLHAEYIWDVQHKKKIDVPHKKKYKILSETCIFYHAIKLICPR